MDFNIKEHRNIERISSQAQRAFARKLFRSGEARESNQRQIQPFHDQEDRWYHRADGRSSFGGLSSPKNLPGEQDHAISLEWTNSFKNGAQDWFPCWKVSIENPKSHRNAREDPNDGKHLQHQRKCGDWQWLLVHVSSAGILYGLLPEIGDWKLLWTV